MMSETGAGARRADTWRLGCVAITALVSTLSCSDPGPSSSTVGRAAEVRRQSVDTLVLGGHLVTMDSERRVIDNGAVVIDDGVIVALGPAAELGHLYEPDRLIMPGRDDLVLPGLINGHTHAAMTLLRGVADDLRLMDWLQNYIFPIEAQLVDSEFVRVGTRLAAMEMIRTGTTTFADMYYFEDAVAEVVLEVGMRGVLGETILDFPAPDHPNVDQALAATEEFLTKWRPHPRIIPAVAPHSAYLADPSTLVRCAELAREHGAPLLIHLAETRDELEQVRERYGATPVQHLARIGFLGPDVVGAHSIWVDESDRALLAERGVGVVHNPESNMKLASGTMPLAEIVGAGVAVGLGTDGPASNNDLDMFGAMSAAALLHKHASSDPTALPALQAVALATIDGARALNLDDMIGSLETGKRADLIIVNGDAPSLVPLYDPYSHATYAARGSDVELAMVDGRVLYENGAFRTLDPDLIRADARRLAKRVVEVVSGDTPQDSPATQRQER